MQLMTKKKLMITACFCCFVLVMNKRLSAEEVIADTNKNKMVDTSLQTAAFPIRTSILTLSSKTPEQAKTELLNKPYSREQLNPAEQYLFLLTQAKIKHYDHQYQQALQLIKQAKTLKKDIAEQLLQKPIFNDLNLTQAQLLVAIGDFEQAYQAKKNYINNFNDYSDATHHNAIQLLNEKYEIVHKIKENELLEHKNKLEALQLSHLQKEQGYQKRNLFLILGGILVFAFLLVRQYKLRNKLLLLSKTDSLTGLLNRSALFIQGQKLIKNTVEQQQELSVLLSDIDHFKRANDDYGHNVGDIVLMEVANLVNETMRSRDIVSRLGGEEFVILLPDTDTDKAKAIAVRVLEKIAEYDFNYLGIKRGITLSIGVANIKDTAPVFDEILHAADLAMYQAKLQGRNQMVNYATIAKDQERRVNA